MNDISWITFFISSSWLFCLCVYVSRIFFHVLQYQIQITFFAPLLYLHNINIFFSSTLACTKNKKNCEYALRIYQMWFFSLVKKKVIFFEQCRVVYVNMATRFFFFFCLAPYSVLFIFKFFHLTGRRISIHPVSLKYSFRLFFPSSRGGSAESWGDVR